MPFIPVIAKQLGVSQVGVGIMYTILPFVGLVAKPLFGFISDKFRIGKIIFMLAIALTGVFFSSICFIPGKSTEAHLNLECNSSAALLRTCDNIDTCTFDSLKLDSSVNDIMNCSLNCMTSVEFLEDMCSEYDLREACNNNGTLIDLQTSVNVSQAVIDSGASNTPCLFFPVKLFAFKEMMIEDPLCSSSASMNCRVVCDNLAVQSFIQKPIDDSPDTSSYSTLQFQMLLGLMIGSWASMSVVVSLSDSICFSLLGKPLGLDFIYKSNKLIP